MSWNTTVITALGLLTIGLLQAVWVLRISPWIFIKEKGPLDLAKRIERKSNRDKFATWFFLLFTAFFSILNIRDSAMNEPVSKKEFEELAARVAKLENKAPPSSGTDIETRLSTVESKISDVVRETQGLAGKDDLEKTRKELEEIIEKVVADMRTLQIELKKLKTLLRQKKSEQARRGLKTGTPIFFDGGTATKTETHTFISSTGRRMGRKLPSSSDN